MQNMALSPAGGRERRDGDGLTRYVGMVIALVSWAMLFASLLLAYVVLRVQQPVWPPLGAAALPVPLAAASTMVLLGSSLALVAAQRRLRSGDSAGISWLRVTLCLGAAFLALQCGVWWVAWHAGLEVSGVLGSVLYALSGLHALHILGGLAALIWLLLMARRGPLATGRGSPVVLVALFWHFLDLVWLAMFLGIFIA